MTDAELVAFLRAEEGKWCAEGINEAMARAADRIGALESAIHAERVAVLRHHAKHEALEDYGRRICVLLDGGEYEDRAEEIHDQVWTDVKARFAAIEGLYASPPTAEALVFPLAAAIIEFEEFGDDTGARALNPNWGVRVLGGTDGSQLLHSGDCTNCAWTCTLCLRETHMDRARAFLRVIGFILPEVRSTHPKDPR